MGRADDFTRLFRIIFEKFPIGISPVGIVFGTPAKFKKRSRLVASLVRELPQGRLSVGTLKDLQEVVLDTIEEGQDIIEEFKKKP